MRGRSRPVGPFELARPIFYSSRSTFARLRNAVREKNRAPTLADVRSVLNTRLRAGPGSWAPKDGRENVQDRASTWVPELSLMEFTTPATAEQPAQEGLGGVSERIERVRGRAEALARNGFAAVLITGEPGTGKRRVSRWMHGQCRRGERPLISVDSCSPRAVDVVTNLVRSLANREPGFGFPPGNLAVENIHAAPPVLAQALVELLTVQGVELRCGLIMLSCEPVGTLRSTSLEHGLLLGRSGSSTIELPPLRDRAEDIPVLARAFLDEAAHYYGRSVRGLSPQAAARLQQHPFPGNARELRASIEQALLRSSGDWVSIDDLPFPQGPVDAAPQAEVVIRLPGSSLREIELQAIKLALRLASGRLVRASELLGITRHALRRKLEKYGLNELRARPATDDVDEIDDAFI